jgi:rhodanese-related sulfurtransferase
VADFLPVVNARRLRELIDSQTAMVVDARRVHDYVAGHIEGAVNIPPNASAEYCLKVLANAHKNQQIVVYCQSETCTFSEDVALKLQAIGYMNILLYKGGWVDWIQRNRNI